MKVIGCIMEINPPHNGHSFFLDQIKKQPNDILVVICSTTIVQRGEFSVINKHDKAQYLLDHGADIVIELPSIYANQGGYYFAKMAVSYLLACGISDIFFGSESANLSYLKSMINDTYILNFEKGIYKNQLQNLLSNDILAISYLKHLPDDISIHLVKRINNNYNDNVKNNGNIQSATYIRNHLHESDITQYLDKNIYQKIHQVDNFNLLFPTFIINLNYAIDNRVNIFLSEHGELLFKLAKIIKNNNIDNFSDLIILSIDKNNSRYKIQRLIINIIFLIEEKHITHNVEYMHVLGLSKAGRNYLKDHNISYITSLKHNNSYLAKKEILISNIYNYLTKQNIAHDFLPPIIS